jgi:hypothetical protein
VFAGRETKSAAEQVKAVGGGCFFDGDSNGRAVAPGWAGGLVRGPRFISYVTLFTAADGYRGPAQWPAEAIVDIFLADLR